MDTPSRMLWIDNMKTIGIYFIVLGHFFSVHTAFIYVFNVPLFFIISGFLCKHESNNLEFWKKLWWNLIVPMIIICITNSLITTILEIHSGCIDMNRIINFIPSMIMGMHRSVGVCWFIYTLMLIKIIYQFTKGFPIQILLFVILLSIAYVLHETEIGTISLFQKPNSIINVCTAFPFFLIGAYLRYAKEYLNSVKSKYMLFTMFAIGMFYLYLSGHFNGGDVWMFMCKYGKDIFWFLVGGMAGTLAVYSISKMLNYKSRCIELISEGTIIILGFHVHFIGIIRRHISAEPSMMDFIYAAIIVILFIPIIYIIGTYFPLMIGKYRATKLHIKNIE